MPPASRQLALQFAAALLVISLAWPYYGTRGEALPWGPTAAAIGTMACLFASISRQPWWWRLMHALFAPLAWAVVQLNIDPGWFLAASIALLLVYRGALTGRIPLYFSNAPTAQALGKIVGELGQVRFLDIGAGIGSVIAPLARHQPSSRFEGLENAPLTWLAGRLYTAGNSNCHLRFGDLWAENLGPWDVVYAFLSPEPMPELARKVAMEMNPQALFISNSFPVPGVQPERVVEVDDTRQTRLYCYRPASLARIVGEP